MVDQESNMAAVSCVIRDHKGIMLSCFYVAEVFFETDFSGVYKMISINKQIDGFG